MQGCADTQQALALIYAGKYREADELLAKAGFVLRLSNEVFEYARVPARVIDCPVGRVFDNVLPAALVKRLSGFLGEKTHVVVGVVAHGLFVRWFLL